MKLASISLTAAFITIFFTLPASAQWGIGEKGNGQVVTTTRDVSSFSKIDVSCSADVFIRQGNNVDVKVRTDENLQEMVETKVKGDELEIDIDGNIRNYKEMEIYITVDKLSAITINGSGDVESENEISGMDFEIGINGSGNVDINFDVKNLSTYINGSGDVEVSGVQGMFLLKINGSGDFEAEDLHLTECNIRVMGSGDVSLSGTAEKVEVEQMASGDINLYGLQARDVEVSTNGSGDAVVSVSGHLKARLRGSGDLTYKGDPTSVDVSASGSGEVYHR
ncbi:MAG: head GIN domain-containing protein [Bacteroidales bacterium]